MEIRWTTREKSYLQNSKQYQRDSPCTPANENVNSDLKQVVR